MSSHHPNKKSRLTQRQWLNIIIVIVSAMLLLSVLIGRLLNKQNEGELSVKKNEAIINTQIIQIDFGEIQLSLQNKSWVSTEPKFAQKQILPLVKRWHELLYLKGEPLKNKLPQGKTVLIYLSNNKQPIVAKILKTQNEIRISFIMAGIEFVLPASDYSLYYPENRKIKG